MQYKDKAPQDFFLYGKTLYETRQTSWGRWRVDNTQYCSLWPSAEEWACFDVHKSNDGMQIRFSAKDGYNTDVAMSI